MTLRLLAALALVAALLGACSSDCEELAEKICACEPTRAQIDACKRRAAQRESKSEPGPAAQEKCASFVDTCDCHAIGTAAGDRACGLAE
ncbi:MAG TPA: hypothetical protein VGD74_08745 [Vulgatibacter sp.]